MVLCYVKNQKKKLKMEKLKKSIIKSGGRKTMAKSIFVKELGWKVIVPTKIANYLLHKIENVKPFHGFRQEVALYFLSLITSVPARKKDSKYIDGYVPLSSKLLEKSKYNYKKYLDYFLDIGIIEKLNYSTNRSRSNAYRYNYKKIKMEGLDYIDFSSFDFSNLKTNKLINYQPFSVDAVGTCEHLLEWFDHGLHLDFESFLNEFSGKKFIINKFDDERDQHKILQKISAFYYNAYDFHLQNWRAGRNKESDNRLHTNLTNLDKDIRKYVRYQGETIKSLDLKNSQPYFLVLFIEEILNKSIEGKYKNERLNLIMDNIYGNKSTMFERLVQCINNESFMSEFSVFKNSILSGQYYEFLGDIFDGISPKYTLQDGTEIFREKFYDKGSKKKKPFQFVGKRNFMKRVSMLLLYTPLTRPSEYYEIFRSKFPTISEFMEILKTSSDDKDSFKKFPKLLQHYEADCVLDFITKKVSEKYPNMPLFTIHDSIATTWCWFEFLEREVNVLLNEYSNGIPPLLESETWGDEHSYGDAA